jgi:hypothetical protein
MAEFEWWQGCLQRENQSHCLLQHVYNVTHRTAHIYFQLDVIIPIILLADWHSLTFHNTVNLIKLLAEFV